MISQKPQKTTKDIIAGDMVLVQRKIFGREEHDEEVFYEAEVVDSKTLEISITDDQISNDQNQEPTTSAEAAFRTERDLAARQKQQFYVHYVGMNKRNDEWVDETKIVFGNGQEQPAITTPAETEVNQQLLTRFKRRFREEFHHLEKSFEDMDAFTAKLEREHAERTKVKNVDWVLFGEYDIRTWYFSPFPLKFVEQSRKLYFCESCMYYTPNMEKYACHRSHYCRVRQPPGDMIYQDYNQRLRIYEVRGAKQKLYCQSLCLLSKLFLDHKTLYYDVDGFTFYVLCEIDIDPQTKAEKLHIVGHFSKELESVNNLACIMVLPPFQRKGYGKLLIQLSYFMSDMDGIIGTPEKPLSDLGKVSYRSYWWWVLLRIMEEANVENGAVVSVNVLSRVSRIHADDITTTLSVFRLIKYWKGDHVIRVSNKIVDKLKQLNIYHPPKLMLNVEAVRYRPQHPRIRLPNHHNHKHRHSSGHHNNKEKAGHQQHGNNNVSGGGHINSNKRRNTFSASLGSSAARRSSTTGGLINGGKRPRGRPPLKRRQTSFDEVGGGAAAVGGVASSNNDSRGESKDGFVRSNTKEMF